MGNSASHLPSFLEPDRPRAGQLKGTGGSLPTNVFPCCLSFCASIQPRPWGTHAACRPTSFTVVCERAWLKISPPNLSINSGSTFLCPISILEQGKSFCQFQHYAHTLLDFTVAQGEQHTEGAHRFGLRKIHSGRHFRSFVQKVQCLRSQSVS